MIRECELSPEIDGEIYRIMQLVCEVHRETIDPETEYGTTPSVVLSGKRTRAASFCRHVTAYLLRRSLWVAPEMYSNRSIKASPKMHVVPAVVSWVQPEGMVEASYPLIGSILHVDHSALYHAKYGPNVVLAADRVAAVGRDMFPGGSVKGSVRVLTNGMYSRKPPNNVSAAPFQHECQAESFGYISQKHAVAAIGVCRDFFRARIRDRLRWFRVGRSTFIHKGDVQAEIERRIGALHRNSKQVLDQGESSESSTMQAV